MTTTSSTAARTTLRLHPTNVRPNPRRRPCTKEGPPTKIHHSEGAETGPAYGDNGAASCFLAMATTPHPISRRFNHTTPPGASPTKSRRRPRTPRPRATWRSRRRHSTPRSAARRTSSTATWSSGRARTVRCASHRGGGRRASTAPTGPPASARSSLASTSRCILRAATSPRTSPSFRRR